MKLGLHQINNVRTILDKALAARGEADEVHSWMGILDRVLDECPTSRCLANLANNTKRSSSERCLAVWILGHLNATSSARAVLRVLLSDNAAASWHASNALCVFKDKRLVPHLIRALEKSTHIHSREGAIWVLYKGVVDKLALPRLIEAATRDTSVAVRHRATHALIAYPQRRSFLALASRSEDPSPDVRRAAIYVLSCLTRYKRTLSAIPALTKLLRKHDRAPALDNLTKKQTYALQNERRDIESILSVLKAKWPDQAAPLLAAESNGVAGKP